MLSRKCGMLKILQTRLSSTRTKNFQMYKLSFQEAEDSEIKLPTFIGSCKIHGSFRKNIFFCFIDYMKTFDCMDHNKLENS